MVIAHIQAAFSIADRHQGAEADGTSAVSGPDSRAALAVAEARVAIGVAVRGIRARYEQPLVQIDRWGHGVRGWLVRLWVRPGERECEALHGLVNSREVACRNPPQREMRFGRPLEPPRAIPERSQMTAIVRKFPQRFDRLPHGEIEKDERVVVSPHGGGVAFGCRQPPHESRTTVGGCIYGRQLGGEIRHHWRIEGRAHTRDIDLREMVVWRAHENSFARGLPGYVAGPLGLNVTGQEACPTQKPEPPWPVRRSRAAPCS